MSGRRAPLALAALLSLLQAAAAFLPAAAKPARRLGRPLAAAQTMDELEARVDALYAILDPAPAAAAAAAPAAELSALEVLEARVQAIERRRSQTPAELETLPLPLNLFKDKAPLEATVQSVSRAIGEDGVGDIMHVTIDTQGGKLRYHEGQSISVLPPGTGPDGKPHKPRLYSIASSRYGDDGTGTTVSLCVRRAVYTDPATGAEDPGKAGVCSGFLCDSKAGDVVTVAGPSGKGMLMPDDLSQDVIMVATGTGMAPFRAFTRRLFLEPHTPASQGFTGLAWLFLGGPTTESLLYVDESNEMLSLYPDNYRVEYAVSREQEAVGGGKRYVQCAMAEHADELFERIQGGAHLYVCGLKGMLPGIEAMLSDGAVARGLDGAKFLKGLKKKKQLHVEVY